MSTRGGNIISLSGQTHHIAMDPGPYTSGLIKSQEDAPDTNYDLCVVCGDRASGECLLRTGINVFIKLCGISLVFFRNLPDFGILIQCVCVCVCVCVYVCFCHCPLVSEPDFTVAALHFKF